MPINFGYFRVRSPRVCQYNSSNTKPPESYGTTPVIDLFSISYTGSLGTCFITTTGKSILTIVDSTSSHPHNLNINLEGKTIGEVVNLINQTGFYSVSYITLGVESKPCLLYNHENIDISTAPATITYFEEHEYLIEIKNPGQLESNNCTINWIRDNFKFVAEANRWMPLEGEIFSDINSNLPIIWNPSQGYGEITIDGYVTVRFFKTLITGNDDVSRSISNSNILLVDKNDTELSQISFEAAPLLISGTLNLQINGNIKTENIDYEIDRGIPAEITCPIEGPYNFNNTNNTLIVRYNNESPQSIVIPTGIYSAYDLANIINPNLSDLSCDAFYNSDLNKTFLRISTLKGTIYNQVRVENGTANIVLGLTDFFGKRGSGSGYILFLEKESNEDLTLSGSSLSDTLFVKAPNASNTGPFLGLTNKNFVLEENGTVKQPNSDYIVNSKGEISLISIVNDETPYSGVMKKDTELFSKPYTLYENFLPVSESSYSINTQGGWVQLNESALPGRVYTASYKSSKQGVIVNEYLLGDTAVVQFQKKEPFLITSSDDKLVFSLNNGPDIEVSLPEGNILSSDVISAINNSPSGQLAYLNDENFICIKNTISYEKNTIYIKNGNLNETFGLDSNRIYSSTSAKGGESSLNLKYAPLKVDTFKAPLGGNTIIIKRNDVSARYLSDSLIRINSDFYQVSNTTLIDYAYITGSISEPYTIFKDTNDTLSVTIDSIKKDIVLDPGISWTALDIVNKINSIYDGISEVSSINGLNCVKFLSRILGSESSVEVNAGTANRTFGFESGKNDVATTSDTYITITSTFKSTYVNPTLSTTINAVAFNLETDIPNESPKNSHSINFSLDKSRLYLKGGILRLNNKYFYGITNVLFDSDLNITTIYLNTGLDTNVGQSSIIHYTSKPVVDEGSTTLKVSGVPSLDQYYKVMKNNILLIRDTDYEFNQDGSISLLTGSILNSDEYLVSYTAKRFIDSSVRVLCSYYHYNYLKVNSVVKASYAINFPDNFFVNVLHGSSIMTSFKDYLNEKNKGFFNSSSDGFPTGNSFQSRNDTSGSDSYYSRLGILEDYDFIASKWFEFFNNRLSYFEQERKLLNGYVPGANDGNITESDILSVTSSAGRLYPSGYEPVLPRKVPALEGTNQNDDSSSTGGTLPGSSLIFVPFQPEKDFNSNEISNLNTLLSISPTYTSRNYNVTKKQVYAGDPNNITLFSVAPDYQESISVFVEVEESGILQQRNVSYTYIFEKQSKVIQKNEIIGYMDPPFNFIPSYGLVPYTILDYYYVNVQNLVDGLNSAIKSSFGVSLSTYNFLTKIDDTNFKVESNKSSGYWTRQFYVLSAPVVCYLSFAAGQQVALRSRHTLWTGGYPYSIVPPEGPTAIPYYIGQQNSYRNQELTNENLQLSWVLKQMYEWLAPLDLGFEESKIEKNNIEYFITDTSSAIQSSITFNDTKLEYPLSALDLDSTLSSRISYLNGRNTRVTDRVSRLSGTRIQELNSRIATENFKEPRFSWVVIRTHREDGILFDISRQISTEQNNQDKVENNKGALASLSQY